ncbi:MAG: hypothetical protein K8T90_18220 [Planctomycetes bacterium]|nr:hypothetical protein [Planctomycetota bacterium]
MPNSHRTPTERLLSDYLGRLRSQLPVQGGDDIRRELESSLLDRAEGIAAERGAPRADAAILREAMHEVGEPEDVASSYAPRGHVVAPEHYRAFLVWTTMAFAVHLVLVGVATAADRAIHAGPFAVSPVGPHGFLSVAAAAIHALLLDVGLMVVVFAAAPWVRRFASPARLSFGVDAAPRSAGARAVLSILIGCILAFFRDRLFVVMDGPDAHPLFTPWFSAVLPLILSLLAFAVIVDALYLMLGETKATLAIDALHGLATLAVMVHLTRGEPLFQVPVAEAFDSFRAPINGFLDDLGTLVLLALAGVAAVKTVRRLVRAAQV